MTTMKKFINKYFEYNEFMEEYFVREEVIKKHEKIFKILEFFSDYFML